MRHLLPALVVYAVMLAGQEPDLAQLDRAKARASKDAQLTETEKKQILTTYDEAIRSLQDAWRFRAAQAAHERRVTALTKEVDALREEIFRPAVYPVPPENATDDSQAVAELLDRVVSERSARKRALSDLSRTAAELGKRDDALARRRNELAAASDAADDQVAVALTSGSHAWEEAAQVLGKCRRLSIEAELGALNAERKGLQLRRSALPLMRDAAQLRLEAADRAIEILKVRAAMARDRDAARDLASAKARAEAAAAFSPRLHPAASDVIDTATRLWGPSGAIHLQQDLAERSEYMKVQTARVRDVTAAIKRQYEAVGQFGTSADWLQYVPRDLPKPADIRQQRRIKLIGAVRLRREILVIQEQRGNEPALETQIDKVTGSSAGSQVDAQLEAHAREILQLRRNLTEDLLRAGEDLEGQLSDFDSASNTLLGLLGDLKDFAVERVLWSRSVADLPSPRDAGAALLWFLWNPEWKSVAATIIRSPGTLIPGLIAFGFVAILWLRRHGIFRGDAKPMGGSPGRALIKTIILSATFPAVLFWLAALVRDSEGPALGTAIAAGLTATSCLLFPLNFLTRATAEQGAMQCHFGWSPELRNTVHRELKWLRVGLPLAWFFVAALAEVGGLLGDDPFLQDSHNSLGRFAFTAAMLMVLFAGIRLLQPGKPIGARMRAGRRPGIFRLLANRASLTLLILLFVGLAAVGFYTTALVLIRNTFLTVCLTGSLAIAASLMLRWREDRKRLLLDKMPPGDTRRDETQVRQLGHFAITVMWAVGALAIWSGMFPALALLDQINIVPASQTAQGAAQPASALVPAPAPGPKPPPATSVSSNAVTLLDILQAALALTVTTILVKNVPGLLHFTILERFQLDSGATYAVVAIGRYLIMLMGLGFVSSHLGIRWMQVQWLAAALTFGIGFGLQEIFANFASGLILLFDRSIRVGDAVSIGDLSGRVSNIQMRATTVALWDGSQMIVPNKEFITSKLVNWTSQPETRVDLKVGVAYGSDVELIRRLLLELAVANVNVLKTPAPEVLLTAFGSSSIDFELRAYGLYDYGRPKLLDELYRAVYREFGRRDISIAFPRLDVHVREVPLDTQSNVQATA